jgi:pimeloyl-ACP methyl ester carboxylesterase
LRRQEIVGEIASGAIIEERSVTSRQEAKNTAGQLIELAQHDRSQAVADAKAWLNASAGDFLVLKLLLRRVSPRLGDAELSADVERHILRRIKKFPLDLRAVRLMLNKAVYDRDWKQCKKWAKAGLKREPDHPEMLEKLALAERMLIENHPTPRPESDLLQSATPEFALKVLASSRANFSQRLKAMNNLIAAGEFAQAFEACKGLLEACRQSDKPREMKYLPLIEGYHGALAYICENAPPRPECPPLDLTSWEGGPIVRKVPGAIGTVVLFNGAGRSSLFAALIDGLPVNQVFLSDEQKLMFQRGITGLGRDVPKAAEKLKRLLDLLGPVNRLYIGFSASGFGALLYGVHTPVSAVIVVSPPSCGDPNVLSPAERRIDRRAFSVGAHLLSRIPLRNSRGVIPFSDLSSFYRPGGPAPDTTVIYGCHEKVDAMHAERLSVHEGTRTIAVDDGGHRADLPAISSGALQSAIRRVVDQWLEARTDA